MQINAPFRQEFARKVAQPESEEVVDLSGQNRQGNAGGEAYDDRVGDELDDRAELEQSHHNQYQSGHECGHGQTLKAETRYDTVDNDDESACRPSDLHRIASEC